MRKSIVLFAIGLVCVVCSSTVLADDPVTHAQKPPIVCKETLVFKRVDDLSLKATVWRFMDDKIRPAVVYIHGGAFIMGNRWDLAGPVHAMSTERGNVLVSLDYRLAPQTKFPDMMKDIEDGIAWVRRVGAKQFHIDPNRIVVMGCSSGGYMALVCGHRVTPAPTAVVSFCGFSGAGGPGNLRTANPEDVKKALEAVKGPPVAVDWSRPNGYRMLELLGGTKDFVELIDGWDPVAEPEKSIPYSPADHFSDSYPPTVLIHGDSDKEIPTESAVKTAELLKKKNVPHRLLLVKDGDHGLTGAKPEDVKDAYDRAVEFVEQTLIDPRMLAMKDSVKPAQKPLIVLKRTLAYKRINDLDINADVYHFSDDSIRPVVIYIHGGGLVYADRTALAGPVHEMSIERGNVLISIDYRLAPQTKLPEIVKDVEDAIDWVRREGPEQFKVDPNQIVIMGTSSGGYLALLCGHRITPRPTAIVSFGGECNMVTDYYTTPSKLEYFNPQKYEKDEALRSVQGPPLTSRWGGEEFFYYCMQTGQLPRYVSGWDPKIEPEKFLPYTPLKNVDPSFPPTVLLHGDADLDTPFEQAKMMARELERHNVPYELIRVKGGDHLLERVPLKDKADAYNRAVKFIMRRLVNLDPNLNSK